MLSPNQIRANARKFSLEWKDETRERAESQTFWNEFFAVFGVNRRKVGIFEATFKKLKGTQGFIDVYWPKKLVCEQKSRGADLAKATTQALDYLQSIAKVAEEDLPRYVIVCDFEHLHLLDIETQQQQKILVANLADNIELFGFISGYETEFRQQQEAVNIAA
ncbi:MAG TPA: class I SAM-dependent DNA methyltransferase, partial [Agitococcus sp.]|nr:class I SAM-dependent DNA methyltransferase [Agitococcus sp.]